MTGYTPAGTQPPVQTLHGCVVASAAGGPGCTAQTLATGTIVPASVTVAGTSVSFTANGRQQAASLS